MEIVGKIICAILFVVAVILIAVVVLFAVIAIEFKILMRRNRKLKQELSTQELRLLELTALIIKSASLVNSHILELVNKKAGPLNKTCRCTDLSTSNNTDNQK